MKDAAIRTVRTFLQSFLGIILMSGFLQGVVADGTFDVSIAKRIVVSAVGAAIIATVTFVQNVLEDQANLPTVK